MRKRRCASASAASFSGHEPMHIMRRGPRASESVDMNKLFATAELACVSQSNELKGRRGWSFAVTYNKHCIPDTTELWMLTITTRDSFLTVENVTKGCFCEDCGDGSVLDRSDVGAGLSFLRARIVSCVACIGIRSALPGPSDSVCCLPSRDENETRRMVLARFITRTLLAGGATGTSVRTLKPPLISRRPSPRSNRVTGRL